VVDSSPKGRSNSQTTLSWKKKVHIEALMRTQYHFRRSARGLCAWNVHRLIELSANLVRERVPLSAIQELDEPYWANERIHPVTCREIVEHARLMLDCDLRHPVILSKGGRVMDGMHRISKALLEGHSDIEAVRFIDDPEPDHIGIHPDDLPYPD
jgi:hypothetical protein